MDNRRQGKCPKDLRGNSFVFILLNNKRTLAVTDGNGDAYKVYGKDFYEQINSVCKQENIYNPDDYEFERGLSGMDF